MCIHITSPSLKGTLQEFDNHSTAMFFDIGWSTTKPMVVYFGLGEIVLLYLQTVCSRSKAIKVPIGKSFCVKNLRNFVLTHRVNHVFVIKLNFSVFVYKEILISS